MAGFQRQACQVSQIDKSRPFIVGEIVSSLWAMFSNYLITLLELPSSVYPLVSLARAEIESRLSEENFYDTTSQRSTDHLSYSKFPGRKTTCAPCVPLLKRSYVLKHGWVLTSHWWSVVPQLWYMGTMKSGAVRPWLWPTYAPNVHGIFGAVMALVSDFMLNYAVTAWNVDIYHEKDYMHVLVKI